ncbi:MAG TPA: zf-HC2 domain-containing protein [Gemmatimonadaceae bacterium]|nr:zf-HC2 domain-containing protein [Gemmatimonadaceae bacterium]
MTTRLDQWTERLSEYIDGDLGAEDRRALEAHLASCAECRATHHELVRVLARARSGAYRPPPQDLWPGVKRAVEASGRPRRPVVVSFTLGRLAAAAGLVAVIAGGLAWSIAASRDESTVAALEGIPRAAPPEPAPGALGPTALAVASYREAANDLERALEAGRRTLRPETMRVIEENLRAMDVAIAQADSALRQDPGSEYLNQYLVATMQRKLKLLRHAVAITTPRT